MGHLRKLRRGMQFVPTRTTHGKRNSFRRHCSGEVKVTRKGLVALLLGAVPQRVLDRMRNDGKSMYYVYLHYRKGFQVRSAGPARDYAHKRVNDLVKANVAANT